MFWFITDQRRVERERAAVTALAEAAPWLVGTAWGLRESMLVLDFEVSLHGVIYEATLTYPKLFPHCPPAVRPRGVGQRWSNHQYLDGTFCLEWGQDTWSPEVTGGQVIESLHRLLETENPASGARVEAPSRHQLTRGQDLRGTFARFYATGALRERLGGMAVGSRGTLRYGVVFDNARELDVVLGLDEGVEWNDPTLPAGWRTDVFNVWKRAGVFYATNAPAEVIRQIGSRAALQQLLQTEVAPDLFFTPAQDCLGMPTPGEVSRVLIRDGGGGAHFFRVSFASDECVLLPCVSEDQERFASRLPVEYADLATRKVGIVGLGSLGSRVAMSLARSGIKHFILVDDDVLLPGNVCRHPLDWRAVLAHKAQGVADAVNWTTPDVVAAVFAVNLTGQESPTVTGRALDALGGCDLIVDATAAAGVFNLLAGVSASAGKILAWGEVFAGGIGGLLARSRPGKDPTAHEIRAGYHAFCLEHPMEGDFRPASNYGAIPDGPEAEPMIAGAAEVDIIAAHLTRTVLDALLGTEPSLFNDPLYLVGLRRAWAFEAPFHTIPIRIEPTGSNSPAATVHVPGTLEFLVGLLPPAPAHESAAPTHDPA